MPREIHTLPDPRSLTEVDGSRVDVYGSGVSAAIGNAGTLGIFGSADTVEHLLAVIAQRYGTGAAPQIDSVRLRPAGTVEHITKRNRLPAS